MRRAQAKGPNGHIQALEDCLRKFNLNKKQRFLFIVDAEHIVEMVQRAGHALESLGYPALYSHHLRQVSLGKGKEKDGLGFCISYLPLNEDTLERMRGVEAIVYKLYNDVPQYLQEHYLQALEQHIVQMNTRAEIAA